MFCLLSPYVAKRKVTVLTAFERLDQSGSDGKENDTFVFVSRRVPHSSDVQCSLRHRVSGVFEDSCSLGQFCGPKSRRYDNAFLRSPSAEQWKEGIDHMYGPKYVRFILCFGVNGPAVDQKGIETRTKLSMSLSKTLSSGLQYRQAKSFINNGSTNNSSNMRWFLSWCMSAALLIKTSNVPPVIFATS